MKNRKLVLSFLMYLSILINIPTVLCMTPAPIVYVAGDGSGDFNCNGTSDDQIQINQALQFVTENSDYTTVYLKGPFTYTVNDTLLIGSNTTLEGDSTSVVKLADNAGWSKDKSLITQMDSFGHNITVRGFTIDGNGEKNEDVNSGIILGSGYYNLINLSDCQDIAVHDMYLTNNLGDGLKTRNCSNISFHNNTAYLLGHDVLYASNSRYVQAYNNRITCRTNSGLRVYNSNNVNFYNNDITSKGSGGAGIEIQKHGTSIMDDIEVFNNTIHETKLAGIWIFGSGDYLPSSTNVHIHHNQIYDTGTNYSSSKIGGIVSDGFNVLVENNVIDGAYGTGIVQKNVYNNNESSSALNGSGYVVTARNNVITNIRPSSDGKNATGVSNFLNETHSFVLENNCFYNNSGGDYWNVDASSTDMYANPQYADGDSHDYHLMSKAGRWNGNDWVNDVISSPCIDAGYPLSDYSNEPEPNGDRINIGPDGNTVYASKSEMNVPTPILPVANFSANTTEGYAPLTIQFNDSSENATEWNWDFENDGTSDSTERKPVHEYVDPKTYTVNLTVSNENGTDSEYATITVSEKPEPVLPVANFSTNVNEGFAPLSVQFTDLSENATFVNWDFDDGSNSTEENPTHIYSMAGSYNVNLTASNANSTSSKTTIITVSGPYAENYSCVAVWSLPGKSTGSWGYYNPDNGPYNIPFGVAISPSGYMYIADRENNSVVKLDSEGNFITRWGSYGNATGQFYRPTGVAVDSSGNVYVADWGNCRIQKFDSNGSFITKWGSQGDEDGNFSNGPQSIAVDSSDNVYVAGNGPDRIQKFDSDGKFLNRFGMGDVETWTYRPYGIAVDASGNIYLVDGEGACVHQLNSTGGFIRDFGAGGSGHGDGQLGSPSGVAVDSSGNVYVSDNFYTDDTGFAYGSQIQKFNNMGSFITRWGSYGNSTGQFYGTGGIAVDSSGNVYVTDYGGNRLEKFVSDKPVITPVLPTAVIEANTTDGTAPLTVQFNDLSLNETLGRIWTFGNGVNSTDANPIYTYGNSGTFIVNLTVTNENGTDSTSVTVNVSEEPEPVLPVANFSASPTEGYAPLTVQFNDSSENATEWKWDFGDGSSSTERKPVHEYVDPETYIVNLTVSNENGTDSEYATISVITSQVSLPQSINNIQSSPESTWVNWTWSNPNDPSFNHTEIYLNGIFQANTSAEYFNATDLQPETDYIIGTRTADIYGNVNETWVNASAKTKSLPDIGQPVVDVELPVIESVMLFPANTTANSKIGIIATVKDNIEVADVTAGYIQLTNAGSTWRGSITAPSSPGKHSLLIKANDTTGNTVSTSVPYSVVRRKGGVNTEVLPSTSKVIGDKSVILAIKVKNTQNIDDTFKVRININGLPAFYRAGTSWFNWTEKTVTLRAKQEVLVPVKVKVPAGTVTGLKFFRVKVSSEKFSVQGSDTGCLVISRPPFRYINPKGLRFSR